MKKVFVVVFIDQKSHQTYVDSIWENEEKAQKFVEERNEWERSENGEGDYWVWIKVDYHAK